MMMGNKTQENTQNAAKQTKNKQPNNHNQNKTKGQKADSPSKTTVFPLYGGETGENEDNIQSKGLNSLRKSAKCLRVSEEPAKPIKCGFVLASKA